MHDMGYLSQVARAPLIDSDDPEKGYVDIRNEDGKFKAYVQEIRTPALKGLRFNRFVTDSNHNTKDAKDPLELNFTPGCDFLLHDGRACDAIEAAFLHDGPAIKALETIQLLTELNEDDDGNNDLDDLRAFLYSL